MGERIWEVYTDPIPESLLDALKGNRLVAFVGAGVSHRCYSKTRAPLPGWSALLRDLIEWGAERGLLDVKTTGELNDLILNGKSLMVAEECREKLGDDRLGEFLSEVFNPDGVVPARVHDLLAAVPFRGYITTNYDNLLERAHSRVHNRQLRTILPESAATFTKGPQRSRPLLKLHGDLDDPASIVLGHRDYLRLIWTPEYTGFVRSLLTDFTLLFIGYGLSDLDILLPLDQLVHEGVDFRHYLLSKRGTRNAVEKRRLLVDRQITVIEYVDYFDFHNHVDTFLEGILIESGNLAALARVRPSLRSRILVHYNSKDQEDGLFVWHYLFREGAITLSQKPQASQWRQLRKHLTEGLRAPRPLGLSRHSAEPALKDTVETMTASLPVAEAAGVLVVFLAVGFDGRPDLLAKISPSSPVFLLSESFSESDLEPFRMYLSEDIKAGHRQP